MSGKLELRGWLKAASKVASWAKNILKPNETQVPKEYIQNIPAIEDASATLEEDPSQKESASSPSLEQRISTHVHEEHPFSKKFAEIPIAFVPVLTILARNIPDPQLMQIAAHLDNLAFSKHAKYGAELHAAAEWLGFFAERRMRGILK